MSDKVVINSTIELNLNDLFNDEGENGFHIVSSVRAELVRRIATDVMPKVYEQIRSEAEKMIMELVHASVQRIGSLGDIQVAIDGYLSNILAQRVNSYGSPSRGVNDKTYLQYLMENIMQKSMEEVRKNLEKQVAISVREYYETEILPKITENLKKGLRI